MAKIRHIGITTRNMRATAGFFKEAFGMIELPGKPDSPVEAATLSDGYINITVLGWKEDRYGGGHPGLHHFGFHVEDLDAAAANLATLGARELVEHNRMYGNVWQHGGNAGQLDRRAAVVDAGRYSNRRQPIPLEDQARRGLRGVITMEGLQ